MQVSRSVSTYLCVFITVGIQLFQHLYFHLYKKDLNAQRTFKTVLAAQESESVCILFGSILFVIFIAVECHAGVWRQRRRYPN